MKILHVIPSVDPACGGPSEGVKMLCSLYIQSGHNVEVATLETPEKAASYEFPALVHGLGPGLGVYGFSLRAYPWMRKNLPRFDLVILNSIWQYSSLAAYLALLGSGIPYVVFTHGMLDPYFKKRYPLKHVKKAAYWHLFLGRIMRGAKTVCFTAEEEKHLARQSFWNYKVRETVVPYGCFGPESDPALLAEEFLNNWPELRGKRLAITLGRIHPKKGLDILIEAFAATMAQDPQWQLLIVGPDQVGWKKELQKLAARLCIAPRITWIGMLTGSTKWGAFAASEIFVLPSHQENFGIVVAEAQACGLPILISNKINIWREISSYWAGLVNDDTVEGTTASLRRWMKLSAEEIEAAGRRSRKCFEEQFDLRACVRRIVVSFEKLAGR
jgi:glycosyltransferase involved in cell wall biosynthesis